MVDKCLKSIYLLDEIEVCMKHVTDISNVTMVQKEKIVTCAMNNTCIKEAVLLLIPSLRPQAWVAYLNTPHTGALGSFTVAIFGSFSATFRSTFRLLFVRLAEE